MTTPEQLKHYHLCQRILVAANRIPEEDVPYQITEAKRIIALPEYRKVLFIFENPRDVETIDKEYVEYYVRCLTNRELNALTENNTKPTRGTATPPDRTDGSTCNVCGKFHIYQRDSKGRVLPTACDHQISDQTPEQS